jgi:hypothetical protein
MEDTDGRNFQIVQTSLPRNVMPFLAISYAIYDTVLPLYPSSHFALFVLLKSCDVSLGFGSILLIPAYAAWTVNSARQHLSKIEVDI